MTKAGGQWVSFSVLDKMFHIAIEHPVQAAGDEGDSVPNYQKQ